MNENENLTQNGYGEQSGNNPWTYGEQVVASTRWGVSGGASSRSSVLTADGSGSQELRNLLLETVDKLTEASDDQIGASIGDVIERAYTHTEHSLGAIADYLQHLMDRGIVYKPEETTVQLVDPLEELLDDEEVVA